jgi:dihydropteroate synthase
MTERTEHTIRFADGGTLRLGPLTRVMGVINVTPDSFSDGGLHADSGAALEAAAAMVEAGADIIDVGGESSRPGADPVPAEDEAARILPVIGGIKKSLDVRVSVDTMKAEVARRALDAGADMINDITALRDPAMLPLAVEREAPVVLMHMRGTPGTMQRDTSYDDLIAAVTGFLADYTESAVAAGLSDDKIIIDPGIGFGKSAEGNLAILERLHELERVGKPILIGASRKSFIGAVLDLPVEDRLEGSLAVAAYASAAGAHIIRAHDVGATVRVTRMIDAIRGAGENDQQCSSDCPPHFTCKT